MKRQTSKFALNWIAIGTAALALGIVLAAGTLLAPAAQAGDPCCEIKAIDTRTGVLTAVVNATGRQFQFKVPNRALLKRLKVGQKIWADFRTHKVSITPVAPCCQIVSSAARPTPGKTTSLEERGGLAVPVAAAGAEVDGTTCTGTENDCKDAAARMCRDEQAKRQKKQGEVAIICTPEVTRTAEGRYSMSCTCGTS